MTARRMLAAAAGAALLLAAGACSPDRRAPSGVAEPETATEPPTVDADPAPQLSSAAWQLYRQRFITPEGRTLDSGNGGISHSEGQGYAMLFAVDHDDRATFESLWTWTQGHLRVRGDELFAWKWTPAAGVQDRNNATDGDLLIAWALLRAGERWQLPELVDESRNIAKRIRGSLLRPSGHGLLLLPGNEGFERPQAVVVNTAYWLFPAFAELARLDPSPEWQHLTASGLGLLQAGRFGRWQLPPDWLAVGREPQARVSLPPDFPPRFGYSAVRIPLHLVWAGLASRQLLEPFLAFWDHFEGARFVPAWTDLTQNSVDSYDASQGLHAVIALAREAAGAKPQPVEPLRGDQDYYSSSLYLLVQLARKETPS